MPQWDKTRNYYADLEVSPSCSQDDIKKQYRKLALKWHPDRNPGKEGDVGPRFQAIQSAHEILSDDRLRREYDEARGALKGRYHGASGVRGNPWSNAGNNFPPPPSRARPSAAKDRPPSGASRYTNFASGSAGSSTRSSRPGAGDAQNSRSNYDAWNNMRSNKRPTPQAPPPTPGRAPTSAARESAKAKPERGNPPPPPPRSASQRQKAEAAFGSSNRRSGYFPGAGIGDEPPVTSKNYSTTRTHPAAFEEPIVTEDPSGSTAAAQDKRASANINPIPDPLAQFRDRRSESRQSSPYATPGGERLDPFNDVAGLGRSASTRVPPRRKEVPKPTQTYRSRSSSMDSTAVNTGINNEPTSMRPPPNPSAYSAFNSRASQRYTPASSQQRRPSTAESSSSTNPEFHRHPDAAANTQPNDTQPKYGPPSLDLRTMRNSKASRVAETQETKGGETMADWDIRVMNLRLLHILKGTSSEDPSSDQPRASDADSRWKSHAASGKQGYKPLPAMDIINHCSYNGHGRCNCELHRLAAERSKIETDQVCPHRFQAPPENGVFGYSTSANANQFASKSAENINMSFVQEPSEYTFTAGGPDIDGQQSPSKRRAQSGSRSGRRGSNKPYISQPTAPTPRPQASSESMPSGFSAQEWEEQIGSRHFEPPAPSSASTSPTRRGTSRKPKPTKKTSGSAAIVDNGEEVRWQAQPPAGGISGSGEGPIAMDIDTPPMEKRGGTPSAAEAQGVRNIHVEPTRPDWRAGSGSNNNGNSIESATSATTAASQIFTNQFAVPNGGSEDTDEFQTTLSDLRKTEPFLDPRPSGLNTFADMQSTLPFQSQPAERPPLDRHRKASPLEFPTPPVAPRRPPTVAVASIRPNLSQWQNYSKDFSAYLGKWQAFNTKVVEHFSTRQKHFADRRARRGEQWLGDDEAADDYIIELQQDHEVRQKWNQACGDHQERIKEFIEFRDRMK